jgi:uncharacterized integral membrane protein
MSATVAALDTYGTLVGTVFAAGAIQMNKVIIYRVGFTNAGASAATVTASLVFNFPVTPKLVLIGPDTGTSIPAALSNIGYTISGSTVSLSATVAANTTTPVYIRVYLIW